MQVNKRVFLFMAEVTRKTAVQKIKTDVRVKQPYISGSRSGLARCFSST